MIPVNITPANICTPDGGGDASVQPRTHYSPRRWSPLEHALGWRVRQMALTRYLHGVSSHGGGTAGSGRPRALATRDQEELGQPLLHQAGEALVVGLQGGAVHVLDHC